MKKLFFLCFLAAAVMALPAESPRRVFEFGFDVDAGFVNNLVGLNEVFFARDHVVVIDFNKLPLGGIGIGVQGNAKGLVNVTVGDYSFGSSTGADVTFRGSISDGLRKLLAEGYSGDLSVNIDAGASAFAYTDLRGSFVVPPLRGWKFYLSPAYYIPVLYVPPAKAEVKVENITRDDGTAVLALGGKMTADVYTPISIEDVQVSPDALLAAAGFDVSLGAEYNLTSLAGINLDVGGLISHIPLKPGIMSHRMQTTYDMTDIELDIIDAALNGNMPELDLESESTYGSASRSVYRPLVFDFYARYRPFESDLITITPTLGFSALTVFGEPSFNAEVSGAFNYGVISLELSSGYRERLWKHAFGFALNLGVVELDLRLGLQSQGFVESFGLRGLNIAVGLRMGVPRGTPRDRPRPAEVQAPAVEPEAAETFPPERTPTERAREVMERYEATDPDIFAEDYPLPSAGTPPAFNDAPYPAEDAPVPPESAVEAFDFE
jgi:hypothetical protein